MALGVAMFVVQGVLAHQFVQLPERLALQLGASYGLATVGESRWETVVTACFLHDGAIHLAVNMAVLWFACPVAERAFGSARIAPMVLVSGAFGNVLNVLHDWITRSGAFTVGASGAISGLLAASLVAGWRTEGWGGTLTRVMLRWGALVVALSALSFITTGRSAHAAHLGGALAGAAIATQWKLERAHSARTTAAVLSACAAVVVLCIGIVALRDRTDRFAPLSLQERFEFTHDALEFGRCGDAREGLLAVERLRAKMAPVTSLRNSVEETCGHADRAFGR